VWADTPSWVFHQCGVERRRADTVRVAATYAARLDDAVTLPRDDALARLTALPGVGVWTAAEVAQVALGDADAVSVGDYHLPNTVAWALAGEARADDNRMLELLEPFRPHRARVIRLLEAAGIAAPKFGPRMPLHPIAHL
jgi:3-methyladenine DNA glycosylase/8-oxoguanine DNA glycosylase